MDRSEPTPQMVAPGDLIADKYQVERVLGRGGMGVVVGARHIGLGTRVAIKCLLPTVVDKPELVARFLREAQTASLIASEHVTRVLDVGTRADGSPFIVMEYLEGRDLSSILLERGRLAIPDAVDFALQTCEALAVAHSAGIVHRDLKPANLFMTELPDGAPLIKILDFGISKKQGGDNNFSLTRTDSAIMGSPAYISPEQIRSQKRVDGRADIWSLGVSLFEMLSGQLPFMAENLGGLMAAILADPPLPLRSIRAEVPPALEAVVHACLEKSVAARPANVALLAQALRPFGGPHAAASADRTMGVVARTTGGSWTDVQASAAPPRAAPPPGRRLAEAGTTRPLGTSAELAGVEARPRAPSAPDPEKTVVHRQPSASSPSIDADPERTALHTQAPAPPPAATEMASWDEYNSYSVPAATAAMAPLQAVAPTVNSSYSVPETSVPVTAASAGAGSPPGAASAPASPTPGVGGGPSQAASATVTASAWGQSAPAPDAGRGRTALVGLGAVAALVVGGTIGWLVLRGGSSGAATEGPVAATTAAATPTNAAPGSSSSASATSEGPAEPAPSVSAAPSATASASAAPAVSAEPDKPLAAAKPAAPSGPTRPRPAGTSDLNKLIQNRK